MTRRLTAIARLTACVALAGACASLVDVQSPGVITNDKIDPGRDARILSLSARQNFANAYSQFILSGAWFSGEAISAETDPAAAEFDGRRISADNTALLTLWRMLSIARESAERVVNGLRGSAGASSNIDVARAALFAGYSYVFMAEHFCEGTASGGPLLDDAELLRRADHYFTLANAVADSASRVLVNVADRAEAVQIATAALVGGARARLQIGDPAGAIAAAQTVPADFEMSLWYSDDPTNLGTLSNTLWFHTALRGTLAAAPAFRALHDPRVAVAAPSPDLPPLDGVTPFWTQRKYASYAAPIRLASGLETRYIAAEAQGSSAMLAFIDERRQANGQAPYGGAKDNVAVLGELMSQRSRDFFLEGKRVGDARRNPGLVPYIPRSGTAYHKDGFPPIGDNVCWPLPSRETQRFPP